MFSIDGQSTLLGLCVALGIGLLIGIDRERRKGVGPTRGSAGIRTFALASLLGAVAMLLGSNLMLAVATIVVGGLAILGYQRSKKDDPGMTSEIALILTCLLGGLSMREPLLAAAIGAALAVLLAAKNRIHHFVSSVLTERELHDALLFITAALILLPLAPDRFLGPFDAINPREIAMLIVLVMVVLAGPALRPAVGRAGCGIYIEHSHHLFNGSSSNQSPDTNAGGNRRRCALLHRDHRPDGSYRCGYRACIAKQAICAIAARRYCGRLVWVVVPPPRHLG